VLYTTVQRLTALRHTISCTASPHDDYRISYDLGATIQRYRVAWRRPRPWFRTTTFWSVLVYHCDL